MSANPTSGKQDFTAVALNQIQCEKIKKEMRHHHLNRNFHANPHTMGVVTPKPNQRANRFLDKDQAILESFRKKGMIKNVDALLENESMKQLLNDEEKEQQSKQRNAQFRQKLLETTKTPVQRFQKPQTSSHAYGWFNRPLYESKRFYQPRNRCDETAFADALVRSSTTGAANGQGEKK
mmetsp:Transcript_1659/g.5790  ORF Transcript_1659/g.5790 Transcript_1659/m.5790 type:complete len:179 (-) Transcript_1659:167-703(-)|eukprot:CAMPEP_0117450790 /NCGR_PEP_ID=MMETSP0759-20121206/8657_1 /TAXON_ID=63605 /ORGANISM="Percolomonas cosmopolitus, Strain WS" /LENGTH=178 /DNA_ID=CAMNT_0005243337 /DNA_START=217 /DNA_END=753 /DNA_ORIENTATION=+